MSLTINLLCCCTLISLNQLELVGIEQMAGALIAILDQNSAFSYCFPDFSMESAPQVNGVL